VLTVRRTQTAPRQPAAFEFVDARTICLAQGAAPEPGSIYELRYHATNPRVLGIGFAATRDIVSHLRNSAAGRDLLGRQPTHALGFGISQAGRYLRDHLAQGFNRDEAGARVFDGMLIHVAGIGRVFFNTEFGQPARTRTWHEDHGFPEVEFPFATAALMRDDDSDPKVIETNTSTEYWQKGASLTHIDADGKADLVEPPNSRVYLIAGTQHGGAAGSPSTLGACANPRNPHNPSPVLRALIVALEDWVVKGIAPPPSRVPSLAAGTAVPAASVVMPALHGMALARGDNPVTEPIDWVNPPEEEARARDGRPLYRYETRVPAVDADGNETDGIRLPPIAVPLATYTGWNVYRNEPTELCDRSGTYEPFARTRAERDATGDPRLSITERYSTHAAYVAKVKAVADALVAERLLLPADAARYIREAERSDRF
jgi:hypothetical protein